MTTTSPIIVAMDFPDRQQAEAMADRLDPSLCRVKVGKELFTRFGPRIVEGMSSRGFELFLDLKFHDIPNTVAAAVRAAADLGVWMVNVHASGGRRMMEAAREALDSVSGEKPLLTAVTVLTSMADQDLAETGVSRPPREQVLHLAALAEQSGMDGIVCSAQEASELRSVVGADFKLVTPGIRPVGSAQGDQRRIATPQQAIADGVDYLVMGRPITQAENPVEVLKATLDSLG